MTTAIFGLPHYHGTMGMLVDQTRQSTRDFLIVDVPSVLGQIAADRLGRNVQLRSTESRDAAAVRRAIGDDEVRQLVSFSDRAVVAAAVVRQQLGIDDGNTPEVELGVVDKKQTRDLLSKGGLNDVRYAGCKLEDLREVARRIPFPFVAKPTSLTGSLCVELITGPEGIDPYIERCRNNKRFDPSSSLIVEEYIRGAELSVEGIVIDGRPQFFGVCEKLTSGKPYFVEVGHDFYAAHPRRDEIYAYASKVIACLGMSFCPFHIELKATDAGYEVIEAHTRFGGHMIMELVGEALNIHPYTYYVDALHRRAVLPLSPADGIFSVKMLFATEGTVKAVSLRDEVTSSPNVISSGVDYRPGDAIERNVHPINYVGYVTYRARDKEESRRFGEFVDAHSVVQVVAA